MKQNNDIIANDWVSKRKQTDKGEQRQITSSENTQETAEKMTEVQNQDFEFGLVFLTSKIVSSTSILSYLLADLDDILQTFI